MFEEMVHCYDVESALREAYLEELAYKNRQAELGHQVARLRRNVHAKHSESAPCHRGHVPTIAASDIQEGAGRNRVGRSGTKPRFGGKENPMNPRTSAPCRALLVWVVFVRIVSPEVLYKQPRMRGSNLAASTPADTESAWELVARVLRFV